MGLHANTFNPLHPDDGVGNRFADHVVVELLFASRGEACGEHNAVHKFEKS